MNPLSGAPKSPARMPQVFVRIRLCKTEVPCLYSSQSLSSKEVSRSNRLRIATSSGAEPMHMDASRKGRRPTVSLHVPTSGACTVTRRPPPSYLIVCKGMLLSSGAGAGWQCPSRSPYSCRVGEQTPTDADVFKQTTRHEKGQDGVGDKGCRGAPPHHI